MADVQYLTNEEVAKFLDDLDHNNDGVIAYDELERKLDEVHNKLAPKPKPHNLNHKDRDPEERHRFLRRVLGTQENQIPRDEFADTVRSWKVPSLEQDKKTKQDELEYFKSIPLGRRLRAYWEVRGPELLFVGVVVSMQIAFGVWQLVKYLTQTEYRQALGWGVVMAKTSAGILYPTLFFLVISMSRWLSTFARKSYFISRFINWDLSQAFHIKISIAALGFASLHAIGHLTGSFLYGSRPAQQDNVAALGLPTPRPYRVYVASLPGWSGIVAFSLFWTLAGLSMPWVRKKSYEIFQLGHLLMFPILGLLCAHGTAGLLQYPMLGYWLALPTLLVVVERLTRIVNGFLRIPATLDVLDDDTVRITIEIPKHRIWPYEAGQYIMLQVPQVSLFQWHPFTISTCVDNTMQVHIKTDGDWTSKLRNLTKENGSELKYVGVDGPFGAPAQRFYDFDHSIIIGSGIGVTPFSGILTDLRRREDRRLLREGHRPMTPSTSRPSSSNPSQQVSNEVRDAEKSRRRSSSSIRRAHEYRQVDFHWIVADRNYLLWFSSLLNAISQSSSSDTHSSKSSHLNIRIQTHVTKKHPEISNHVFRYLLEIHRTESHPESLLTGLINETHFGRPDLPKIMDEHYEGMLKLFAETKVEERRVGVFFCGSPAIGMILSDTCKALTLRGREDRSLVEYHFMMEVFG